MARTVGIGHQGKLVREGTPDVKITMEDLLQGKTFYTISTNRLFLTSWITNWGQSGACFWPAVI